MGLKIEYLTGDGGDYPLIRIFGQDAEAVGRLIAAIGGLSLGGPPVSLNEVSGIESVNCSLKTVVSAGGTDEVRPDGKSEAFLWTISEDSRETVLGLLEPFRTASPHDTFQWLSGPRTPGDTGRGIGLVISTDDLGRW